MMDEAGAQTPFIDLVEQVKELVFDAVTSNWDRMEELNQFSELVYLKNTEGVIVVGNEAFREWFSPGGLAIGRSTRAFLDKTLLDVARQTDFLVTNSLRAITFEHTGRGPDGRYWLLQTHKQNISHLGNPGLTILGVSRWHEALDDGDPHPKPDIAEQHRRFCALDETDREICSQIGAGVKVREIAEALDLTSRAVEQRKKKILETLELGQTIDLVKLLVRLQDGGYVDLGL